MVAMDSSAISVSGLRKAYRDKTVLDGIDLNVRAGTVFALLGPNGAGKTTTVNVLTTLLTPDAGRVVVAGHDVVTETRAVRAAVGVTGQFASVDDLLTGRENLLMMADLLHLPRAEGRQVADRLLDRFDLVDAANRLAASYSGGMRRKLDLAMTLVGRRQITFLDEPTAGLDPGSRRTMWEIIRELVAGGMTIFLTTQYLEEADELAHRVGIINAGKLVAEGTPADLKRSIGNDLIIARVHGHPAAARAAVVNVEGVKSVDARGNTLVVAAVNGAATIGPVAVALDGCGVPLTDLRLRTPTLDDVFLELTGSHIRPNDDMNDDMDDTDDDAEVTR